MQKVALITGSGRKRVGFHVAKEAGKRGYAIALHYNSSKVEAEDSKAELTSLGYRVNAFQADLSVESEVKRMMEEVLNTFNRLDVLVTAASIWPKKKLLETSAKDVLENFSANTLSTFLCCKEAGLIMSKQSEGGSIVTIGDWATERPYCDYSAYFISKGSIPTLTRVFATELAKLNPQIRVNCILPGPVMLPEGVDADEVISKTVVKRLGSPEAISKSVFHFVENDFVTGTCLPVDGGRTIFSE